ncbi:hypothetical protein BpHYR1_047943 [Brachionus plicatilis]|uniref:Uncharacterized protein n=1 Tax=Brachionus plicatilis TaxID=10195 RepID=A0A3M7S0T4_BRAPC|nr:hypothetical protein BpHYR1_047943 [Brachionus plicatilis]
MNIVGESFMRKKKFIKLQRKFCVLKEKLQFVEKREVVPKSQGCPEARPHTTKFFISQLDSNLFTTIQIV